MDCEEIIERLDSLSVKGMDFGVERTRAILDKLGCPDKKLKIIHIAGTNGKGSVAEYVTRILIAAEKSVGTFTSPAVYGYAEQFKVNGERLDGEIFEKAFGAALKAGDGATRFEVETAGALYSFVLSGCEYAVVECGLGGRYDATNAVLKKEIALITSISLEHTNYLGNTLESICFHKSGIIKDCPSVISSYNPPEVLNYFKKAGAAVAGCFKNPPLKGEAQEYNAGVAAMCARMLKIDENAIYTGVNAVKLGARIEVLNRGTDTYILDGAHNPAALLQLAKFIKQEYGRADCMIFGSLSDKDVLSNVSVVKAVVKSITAVKPDSPRAMDVGKVLDACGKQGVCAAGAESLDAALKNARGVIAVCGTFTILKEAKLWIEKRQ